MTELLRRVIRIGPWLALLGALGVAISNLWPETRTFVYALYLCIIVIALLWPETIAAMRVIDGTVTVLVPYSIFIGFAVVAVLLFRLDRKIARVEQAIHSPSPVVIKNTPALGGLFNSREKDEKDGYIHAFENGDKGTAWVVDETEQTISFSFDRHNQAPRYPWGSSGGFITFYDLPRNRLVYQYLSFACRATNTIGQADVGIRIAVDDPQQFPSPEFAARELRSLNAANPGKPVSSEWQHYELYVLNFTEPTTNSRIPAGRGLDGNSINKIVFFISNGMIDNSPGGTLWFRDILFSTSKRDF